MRNPDLHPPAPQHATASSSLAESTPSTNSPTPPYSQLTLDEGSSASRYHDAPSSHRDEQLRGLNKLQTDFGEGESQNVARSEESAGYDDDYDGDDSGMDRDEEAEEYTPQKETADSPHLSKSYTPDEERRVVKKFDKRLTLFMALLYMLAFLDRSSNAKIAGLSEDLRLSSSQYEWALTAFYVTYICFEWMTLLYRVVPAHIYVSLCVFSWGLIAACQSLVSSFWALVLLRALLGISEAAFSPGLPFYLSFFYKREELAYRTGVFISAAPLATSFASTLAWAIVKLSKNGPIAPWRSLFLLEGFPSVIVAVFAWIYVPDGPGKARYLTPRERKVAKLRLKMSDGTSHRDKSRKRRFDWGEIGRTLRDPKAYLTALMFFSCNVAFSSLPVFLPTILKDMGYSPLTSQALSAPPYLLSFLIVLLTAAHSDRHRTRSPYIITHALLSSLAYLTISLTGHFHTHIPPTLHSAIRYLAIYPAAAGFFSAITIIITWTMDNQPAKEGKGMGMVLLNVLGQCGPLLGTRLYPEADGPWYVRGMAVCAVFMLFVAGLAGVLRVLLRRENERGRRRAGLGGEGVEEEIEMVEGEAAGLMGSEGRGGRVGKGGDGDGDGDAGGRFVYII
ncbi:hypothetical protein FQN52_008670 [Onygenales sp. PD_12]|nr:hypothetical protein FQN52_008670 [Onygenales sp. PD_12]